ncbi:MAG: efflux RND transporter permease subunit [Candidatus Omnitrophota bacterium]|nr:MAG: efflux RND transporter permease subunit [Candidatus Omnitrophota bacterium]
MNLPKLAITRPVATAMFFTAFILVGIMALFRLPVELYPNISFGEISIIIQIRGGIPPTEVETLVTKPIEEAVSTTSHLEEMLSISKEGESTIVLSFEPGIDMDFAALEVREKFARVKNKLPKEVEKPIIAQFKRSDVPIMILAVTSSKRTTEKLRKIVDEVVKERIKRVGGVANVEVGGGRERKILVEVSQRALVKYSLPLERVINMLGLNNLNLLSGEIKKEKDKYLIRTIGEFESLDDIKNIGVSTTPDGSIVRLKDVAEVRDSYLEPTGYARINIRPVVSLYIQKESTGNTIRIAQNVLKEIDKTKTIIPDDVKIVVTSNQADFIRKSIGNLKNSLFKGAILIMLILAFFLGRVKKEHYILIAATIIAIMLIPAKLLYVVLLVFIIAFLSRKELRPIMIVTASIPISVVITFGLMELCNTFFSRTISLTINFITMFGLALGVGMLVDNSIVVFENILKKIEEGQDKINAAVWGASEMNLVIMASTLTTVIVFLPMIFVGKEMKLLYGGVAWTVTFSLIVSLFVALTVVPLLSSRAGVTRQATNVLMPLYMFQKKMLLFILRRRFMIFGIVLLVFFISVFLSRNLGREFIGTTEQNKFTIFIEMPTGAKLDVSNSMVKRVEDLVREVPEVKTFTARVEPWSSKVYVELLPLGQRRRTVGDVIENLRPKVAKIRPAFIYFEEEQEVGTKEIILDLFGYEYDILRELAISMATRLGGIPKFTDVKIRMREGRPELGLKIDKNKAAQFDLSVSDIATMVHAQMRGLRATLFHTEAREVETITRLEERYRRTFKDLHKLVLVTEDGKEVFMDQIAEFEYGLGPSEIWRKDRSRMIQVSANIGNIPLSKAADRIKKALKDIKFPENYFYRFGGNYPSMIKTQKEFAVIIWVILALIYIVLASLFESYYQPFIIMGTVLLASIGAILVLFLTGTAIGMGVLIGMMMLAGIVVNNGIILVDHINVLRKESRASYPGKMATVPIFRIVIRAAHDRLRPVIMTTATTIVGLLPMALDRSEGANLWNPLALTVIGGMLVATPLTLLLVPAIYTAFERLKTLIISYTAVLKAQKR